jgi:hypothetical protein
MAALVNFLSASLGLAWGAHMYHLHLERDKDWKKRQVYTMVEELERPKLDAMKRQYLAEIDAAMAAAGKSKA